MRKRRKLMRVIWNINGIFFLILFLVLGIGALVEFIALLASRPAQSVRIVDDQVDKPKVTSYQLHDEPILLKDCYIFELQSDIIYRAKMNSRLTRISRKLGASERCSVNLVFVSLNNMKKYLLFKNNVLILEKEYANFPTDIEQYRNILERNLYVVVAKDTNNNDQLDEHDQKDFYVSDYDGQKLRCLAKNIISYSVVDDNQAVITLSNKGKKSFLLYDAKKDVILPLLAENEVNRLGI